MDSTIQIDGRTIGAGNAPYIVAHISGYENLKEACTMIDRAKEAGVDAVAFPTYTEDSLVVNSRAESFMLSGGPWEGKNLYQLYKKVKPKNDLIPDIFKYAQSNNVTALSEAFDSDTVLSLEQDVSPAAFKIAANELVDLPFIQTIIETGKPILLSTGVATEKEIEETVHFIGSYGARDRLILIHCVNAYPAKPEEMNLNTMLALKEGFGQAVGLSNHALEVGVPLTAIHMGADLIEVRYVPDRKAQIDTFFAQEIEGVKQLTDNFIFAQGGNFEDSELFLPESQGKVVYADDIDLLKAQIYTRQFWTTQAIQKGEILSPENVRTVRTVRGRSDMGGVSPQRYDEVFNTPANRNIRKYSPVRPEMILNFNV